VEPSLALVIGLAVRRTLVRRRAYLAVGLTAWLVASVAMVPYWGSRSVWAMAIRAS
jgi:hypothetical protein